MKTKDGIDHHDNTSTDFGNTMTVRTLNALSKLEVILHRFCNFRFFKHLRSTQTVQLTSLIHMRQIMCFKIGPIEQTHTRETFITYFARCKPGL